MKGVNKEYIIKISRQLKRVHIPKKQQEWKGQNVKIRMDNVWPHTVKVVSDYLCNAGFIIVPYPPYSPDLAPNDFFLFVSVFIEAHSYITRMLFG